jgi:hypothetical protein
MPLDQIHYRIALAVLFYTFAMGAWGAFTWLRGHGVPPNFLGALVIGEILVLAQGVLGVILVISGKMPSDLLHFLYGVTIAISWLGVFAYTHGETTRREMGIYALISFFMFGLGIRAMMTGGVGLP